MDEHRPTLEFWYDFASTYSYLSAMRIEAMAEAAGVTVTWRPFLLGPIFKAQGWDSSPFNVYPAKGRYMIRDMQRICHARGLIFTMPQPFPQSSLRAARLLMGLSEEQLPDFTKRLFLAEFGEGRPIDDESVLASILIGQGIEYEAVLARSEEDVCRARLRGNVEEARSRGIFGAPTFVVPDGEIFWGDDRLEMAMSASLKL